MGIGVQKDERIGFAVTLLSNDVDSEDHSRIAHWKHSFVQKSGEYQQLRRQESLSHFRFCTGFRSNLAAS